VDNSKSQKIDALFNDFDTSDKPGVVVGVTQDGRTEYTKAFGMANLEYDLPLTLDSVLQVGSVSKQFTAFAILLLSEKGWIDLDAPVKTYLDYFPRFDHEITVRHMVHHASGLRNSTTFRLVNGIANGDVITKDLDITMLKKQKNLDFEPDTFFSYSNLSYSLMAEIVAKVTGKSFRAYMDETIFKPLGMNNSFFHDTNFELIKNKAEAYTVTPDCVLNCPVVHSNYGATNLYTTVKDMIKWAEELMCPVIFSKKTVAKAFTPYECKNGYKTGYGFGFMVHEYKGKYVIEHGGADAGYVSQIYIIPNQNIAVLLLSNRRDFINTDLMRKVLDIVLDLPDDSSIYNRVPKNEDISGIYYFEKGARVFRFTRTEDGTFLSIMDIRWELFKKDVGLYIIPQFDTEFAFSKKGDVKLINNGNFTTGIKINPTAIAVADRSCAGKYIGTEFDAIHEVIFTENAMILNNNRTGKMPFRKYDNGIYLDTVSNMVAIRFKKNKMYISTNGAVCVEFVKMRP